MIDVNPKTFLSEHCLSTVMENWSQLNIGHTLLWKNDLYWILTIHYYRRMISIEYWPHYYGRMISIEYWPYTIMENTFYWALTIHYYGSTEYRLLWKTNFYWRLTIPYYDRALLNIGHPLLWKGSIEHGVIPVNIHLTISYYTLTCMISTGCQTVRVIHQPIILTIWYLLEDH